MLDALLEDFRRRFGRRAEFAAAAPGRVNLIGEHTDYNEGLVLPCAIDRETRVVGARRDDASWRVLACDLGEEGSFRLDALHRRGGWIDYVQGVAAALAEGGAALPGLDLAIASALPREAGLSSSAALTVGLVCAVDHAAGLGLSPPERAAAAHRAETDFVGLACGIMDPWVSTFGVADHALRIDCRSLGLQAVPLPGDRVRVLVANSGVRRALVAGGYGDRRAECEAALRAARELGVVAQARALRDVGPDALPALVRALPARLARRARHVITENARVDAVCEALDRGELERVGALLGEGMRSLRDDFEVSIPELDFLCERGDAHPGVLGSRLTGAGFGGCTLHLVRPDAADEVADWIADGFARRFGRRPAVLAVRAAAGARVSPL